MIKLTLTQADLNLIYYCLGTTRAQLGCTDNETEICTQLLDLSNRITSQSGMSPTESANQSMITADKNGEESS